MDNYKITHDTWNKVASLYQEKFMDLDLYNDSYDIFCKLIPKKDADILEIGCGPGNITKYLVAARPGFRIMANDLSPNMIDLAKINNPTVEFGIMDCRNIDSINCIFDGIICGFCMPYLSKEDNHKFIKDCSELLRTGGVFYFSTIKGDYTRSGFETGSTGDRAYVYYYSEDDFKDVLIETGFSIMQLIEKKFTKSDGIEEINQIFITKKI